MDAQNNEYAGPEQRETTHEPLTARDNAGIFQKLHSLGRGAIGKVLLATALSGGVNTIQAQNPPVSNEQSKVDDKEISAEDTGVDSVQKQIIYPYGMYDDGGVASVMFGIRKYHIKYEAPDMSNPKEGIYYHGASDAYYHLTDNGQVTKMTFSPERIQPPGGGTWVRYRSGANGQMITRPQTEAEVKIKRRSQRHIRGPIRHSVQKPAMPPEEEKPVDLEKVAPVVPANAVIPEVPQEVESPITEAEAAVKKLGFLTIKHEYDELNQRESLLREKSIVQPTGFVPMHFTIVAGIECDGRGKVLLPCPRDVIDQMHVVSTVSVVKGGKKFNAECKIVYSQDMRAGGAKGYENPFLHITIKGNGKFSVRADHIVLMPIYPPAESEQLIRSMGPSAVLINRAAQTGAAVPWDGSINGFNSDLFRRFGRGDCGVKAAVARDAGGGLVDVAEGYSLAPNDAKYGGRHAINIAQSNGGMLTFDPRTPSKTYIGPQNDYLITGVGGAYVVKDWNNEVKNGANGGYFIGENYEIARLAGSRQIGPGTPPEIVNYIKELWAERMGVYNQGNLAINQ